MHVFLTLMIYPQMEDANIKQINHYKYIILN